MDIHEITELLELGEEYRPAVQEIIDIVLSYSPEIKRIMDPIVDGFTNAKMRMVHNYEMAGFTREEAINLACNSFQEIGNSINNLKKGK